MSKKKIGKVTEIWHTREVKLNSNYNSAGASVGMKATVAEGEDETATLMMLKKKVSASLAKEVEKITKFLSAVQ